MHTFHSFTLINLSSLYYNLILVLYHEQPHLTMGKAFGLMEPDLCQSGAEGCLTLALNVGTPFSLYFSIFSVVLATSNMDQLALRSASWELK